MVMDIQNLGYVPSDLRVHAVCETTISSRQFSRSITSHKSIRSVAYSHSLQAYGHSRNQEMSSFHGIERLYAVLSTDRHNAPARISWTLSTTAYPISLGSIPISHRSERPALKTSKFCVQWAPGALYLGLKQPDREAEVKNMLSST